MLETGLFQPDSFAPGAAANIENGRFHIFLRSFIAYYLNNSVTERPSWMRLMAPAKSSATERTVMLGRRLLSGCGMLSVTTISAMSALLRRSRAGPEKMPCETQQ